MQRSRWQLACDNVALACTASDAGTGLANLGDASFSLVTAVAAGAEDANASTNSRVVCDVAGNCTTAGPISGNKIDRKGPTILLTTPASGAVYQLNQVVNASYSCSDAGSGPCTCQRHRSRISVPSTLHSRLEDLRGQCLGCCRQHVEHHGELRSEADAYRCGPGDASGWG